MDAAAERPRLQHLLQFTHGAPSFSVITPLSVAKYVALPIHSQADCEKFAKIQYEDVVESRYIVSSRLKISLQTYWSLSTLYVNWSIMCEKD